MSRPSACSALRCGEGEQLAANPVGFVTNWIPSLAACVIPYRHIWAYILIAPFIPVELMMPLSVHCVAEKACSCRTYRPTTCWILWMSRQNVR